MEKTLDFYDNFNWDLVVDNTSVELPHVMQTILKSLAARSPQLRSILNHEDSPGRYYFRKRLGSTNILLDSNADAEDDTKKSNHEASAIAPSAHVSSTVAFATPELNKREQAAASAVDKDFGPVPFPLDADMKTREPSP